MLCVITVKARVGTMALSTGNRLTYGLVLVSLLASAPAGAQGAPQQPAAKEEPPKTEDELIVTGRRNGEPDFQEQQEFHYQEYRRLKAIYDPDPPALDRGDRFLRVPEAVTSTLPTKPTITEKQW